VRVASVARARGDTLKIKLKSNAAAIVALCALVYFVSYFARKDFAAVMAVMLRDGVFNKQLSGIIGMGLFICYGIGQLVSGYLGDKIKPTVLLLSGLLTTALCNLFMPLVPSTVLMIPIWALNGFAQAMLWPPIVRILADNLSGERFLAANLVVTSSAHISTIILYIFVPICVKFYDWKAVFFAAAILAFAVLVIFTVAMLFITLNPKKEEEESPSLGLEKQSNFMSLFVKSGIVPIFFAIIMMGFLRDGIESWLPTLYCEAFGTTAEEAILVSAIIPVISIISTVLIMPIHKKKAFNNEAGGAAILFIIAAILCIPISILINFEQSAFKLVCLILAALVCGCMHAINFFFISCLPGRFNRFGRAATASGFSNACTYVGAAASMYGIGAIADGIGWSASAFSWIVIAVLGALFSSMAYKKYSSFINMK